VQPAPSTDAKTEAPTKEPTAPLKPPRKPPPNPHAELAAARREVADLHALVAELEAAREIKDSQQDVGPDSAGERARLEACIEQLRAENQRQQIKVDELRSSKAGADAALPDLAIAIETLIGWSKRLAAWLNGLPAETIYEHADLNSVVSRLRALDKQMVPRRKARRKERGASSNTTAPPTTPPDQPADDLTIPEFLDRRRDKALTTP
jgi:hypothetical protein